MFCVHYLIWTVCEKTDRVHVYSKMESFLGICRWPDNWSNTALPWILGWIEAHAAHAVILGKPLVLQEWGVHVGAPPCKALAAPLLCHLSLLPAWQLPTKARTDAHQSICIQEHRSDNIQKPASTAQPPVMSQP